MNKEGYGIMRIFKIIGVLVLILAAVGLLTTAGAEAGAVSPAVHGWRDGWADTDWQALLDTAKAQVDADAVPVKGALAGELLLDGVTGPFLLVDDAGVMAESDAPFSEVFAYFWDQPARWEEFAAADASPVFMVAERQADRVIGEYSGDVTVKVSVYRLYAIDAQGTLLGWDEVSSKGSAPYILYAHTPRFYDQDPFPAYLDTMRYAREMMRVEGGVVTEYRSIAPAELVLPEGITAIGEGMFRDQEALERVVLPDSLTHIGKSAFSGCKSLAEAALPDNLEEIGAYAFSDCASLTEVVCPASLRRIGERGFNDCTALTRVVLNEGLERVELFAFYGAGGLERVALPDSLLSLGRYAFADCRQLAEIDFGQGSPRMDIKAFDKTPWLEAQAGDYVVVGDTLIDYRGEAADFAVPEDVRHVSVRIEDEALESLILPEGVQSVGSYAFDGCKNLLDITFPESLTHVGAYAFRGTAWFDALEAPALVGGGVYFQAFGAREPYALPEGITCLSLLWSGKQLLSPLVIPDTCVCIEGVDGFTEAEGGQVLHIPQTVTTIDSSAFGSGKDITVHCAPGSEAERWARERVLEVIYE